MLNNHCSYWHERVVDAHDDKDDDGDDDYCNGGDELQTRARARTHTHTHTLHVAVGEGALCAVYQNCQVLEPGNNASVGDSQWRLLADTVS